MCELLVNIPVLFNGWLKELAPV